MYAQKESYEINSPSQVGLVVKSPSSSAGKAGDADSISGLWRSPGEGNDNALKYSCLENPMDSGAWQAEVDGITKSGTQLSNWIHTWDK